MQIPEELMMVKARAMKAIEPLRPATGNWGEGFVAGRTDAGRDLPPYYLVYFLLADLLDFLNLGQFEKVAWSIPVEMNGKVLVIEHRKMGVGVFANPKTDEAEAELVVQAIHRGVRAAEPFFRWKAEAAVKESKLNVENKSQDLFDRFTFLRDASLAKFDEAAARKDEFVKSGSGYTYPAYPLKRQAKWLALAAIEAFYSWTEHVFVHLAILTGSRTSAEAIAELAGEDWAVKFKACLDVGDKATKDWYDKLVIIRRQLRNFVSHGAFGKRGEAFDFHSNAGAVPVLLAEEMGAGKYSFVAEPAFDDKLAVGMVNSFVGFLWSGPRAPAKLHIQDAGLPTTLTAASNGTYRLAMSSMDEMSSYVEYICHEIDRAANMDF